MAAKSLPSGEAELSILKRIKDSAPKDPMATHITKFLDAFEHSGPNGNHFCRVFELMASTGASMAEKFPQNQIQTVGKKVRYPKTVAKLILRHTLLGLAFLHKNGIVHADLQPGNLLFTLSNINSLSEEEFQQDQSRRDQSTTPELLKRFDGKDDKWAPRYLFLGQSLHKYVSLGPEMLVKISDFSAASWSQSPPKSTVTPMVLRAPELIFGEKIDSSIDIWSFGCLTYEFLTGTALFCVAKFGDEDEEADDDHLLELNDVLEPLSDSWLKEKWARGGRYFGPNRERLSPYVDLDVGADKDLDVGADKDLDGGADKDLDDGADKDLDDGENEDFDDDEVEERGNGPWINSPLEALFEKNKPDDIDDAEAEVITSFIRRILKYEPSQ